MVSRMMTSNVVKHMLTVAAVFSPFLHLFAKSGQEGPLHWKWMSSFLNALGWALFAFFIGFVMLLDAKDQVKEKRLPSVFRSSLVLGIGIYYLLYIFFPNAKNFDFSKPVYYAALGAVSSFASIIIVLFVKAEKSIISSYKVKLQKVWRYVYSTRHDFKDEKKDENALKRGKLIKESLDNA